MLLRLRLRHQLIRRHSPTSLLSLVHLVGQHDVVEGLGGGGDFVIAGLALFLVGLALFAVGVGIFEDGGVLLLLPLLPNPQHLLLPLHLLSLPTQCLCTLYRSRTQRLRIQQIKHNTLINRPLILLIVHD